MGKKLNQVHDVVRKYAPLVGSAFAEGARGTAKATTTVAGHVWRGVDSSFSFAYRKYASHQETLDSLVFYTSAACTTAAVVDDYTNLGLVGGALVAGAGAATLKSINVLSAHYLPTQKGEPLHHQLIREGIIATASTLALGAESSVVGAYLSCFDGDSSLLDNVRAFLGTTAEVAYLGLLSYGIGEAAHALGKKIKSLASGTNAHKNCATGIVLAATALATATTTDTLNIAAYDFLTPFDKEGIQAPVDPATLPSGLHIKRDLFGQYVSIHLQSGQSLYSDVVLTYTDFLEHDDVMSAAHAIQRRSLSLDTSKNHTSYLVHVVGWDAENIHPEDELKIPLALLSDRYRSAYQKPHVTNPVPPVSVNGNLKGIHVILDAGHGGADPGSGAHGVVENEVAYDIMVRTKKVLEEQYGVTVYPLVKDTNTTFVPLEKLTDGSNEFVLTTPPYLTKKANVGAYLRAYKTNSIYRDLIAHGVSPDAIIFMSIHTDAISAHAKGMMIYYPDAALRKSSLTKRGSPYNGFAEVLADPTIEIEADKVGSQDKSYTLAEQIMTSARTHGVAVHEQQGIRGKIRRNRDYVPAVIRWNPVPAKILVEAGNCNNTSDAKNLLSPTYREHLAETLAAGIHDYYDQPPITVVSVDCLVADPIAVRVVGEHAKKFTLPAHVAVYVAENMCNALAVEAQYGIPTAGVLAKAGSEHGFGKHEKLIVEANNHFGIKYKDQYAVTYPTCIDAKTWEYAVGNKVTDCFVKYNSSLDSYLHFGEFLATRQIGNWKPYAEVMRHVGTSRDFLIALAASEYSTNPAEKQLTLGILSQFHLDDIVAAVKTELPASAYKQTQAP